MDRGWRLATLVVSAVVLQVAVLPSLRLLGVVPDLGLVLAVAVAYRSGPETGALVGFAAGLGYDLFLTTPLGLSALTYCLVAYAVGVLQSGLLRSPRLLGPMLGGGAGLAGGLLFVGLGIIFGVDVLRTASVFSVIARVALYDALVAVAVFPLVERVVGEPQQIAGW